MSESSPALFGVLVTYRRHEALGRTLGALTGQTRLFDRLLVIDNAADPEVAKLVARYGMADADYLAADDNLGPAGGYALGITQLLANASDADWVFLLDDDDPPFFRDALERAEIFAESLVATGATVGGVGISGGRFDLRRGVVRRIGDHEIEGPVLVDHITGGGLPAYRVKAIRAVGPPLAELFFGYEELEYGLRLTGAGYLLYADGQEWKRRKEIKRAQGLLPPEAVSVARSSTTNWRVTDPSWRRYYSLRNLTYILRRVGRPWTAVRVGLSRGIGKPLANMALSPRTAWRVLSMNLKALRDGWLGRMGRTVAPD